MIILVLCFIAGIILTSFVTFWFYMAYQELNRAKENVKHAMKQVRLHKRFYPDVKNGPHETAATQSIGVAKMIYEETLKDYTAVRRKPLNMIPAMLMGFPRTMREVKQ